jgi:fermentation-respiration switch protein FrsA (DUF1100 family)
MRMLRSAALASALACLVGVGAARAQTAAGDWKGTLVAGPAQSFRLGVHIRKTDAGLAGTLDDASRAIGGLALSDVAPQAVELQVGLINSDWFRFFYDYDPAATLRQLNCPVLALIGSKDLQVPAAQNLPVIRAALAHDDAGAEVEELPDLNHFFEETTAPLALDTITAWILKQVDGAKHA